MEKMRGVVQAIKTQVQLYGSGPRLSWGLMDWITRLMSKVRRSWFSRQRCNVAQQKARSQAAAPLKRFTIYEAPNRRAFSMFQTGCHSFINNITIRKKKAPKGLSGESLIFKSCIATVAVASLKRFAYKGPSAGVRLLG